MAATSRRPVAEHRSKFDVGLSVAHEKCDAQGVVATFDIADPAVALPLVDLARTKRRRMILACALHPTRPKAARPDAAA